MWNIIKILENKCWIKSIDFYSCFQWYSRYWLGRRSYDDEWQIARLKGIVSRLKGMLVEMIKDVDDRFDNYAISFMIRQVFLHCAYELVKNDLP